MNIINREPPKRLAVMLALQKLLEQISEDDGDCFTMAGKVLIGRVLYGADTIMQAPLLSVIEAPRPDFAIFGGNGNEARVDKWTLLIQGLMEDDKTPDTADHPYYFAQDVEKRMKRITSLKRSGSPEYPDLHMLGGMISSVELAPPVIRPPEAQVSGNAFFYIPIRLGIAVEIGE